MAVIVKYVVERHGVEKMTFAQKQDADAYDRMLDMADELFAVLQHSGLTNDEQHAEDLAMYLAQKKDQVLQALGVSSGKASKAPKAKENAKESAKDNAKDNASGSATSSTEAPSGEPMASDSIDAALSGTAHDKTANNTADKATEREIDVHQGTDAVDAKAA